MKMGYVAATYKNSAICFAFKIANRTDGAVTFAIGLVEFDTIVNAISLVYFTYKSNGAIQFVDTLDVVAHCQSFSR